MKKVYLLLLAIAYYGIANSQCTVNVFSSKDTIVCGHSVQLSAFGQAAIPVLSENFNSQSFGPGWSGTTQAMWNNPCSANGVDGTPHLWMGSSSPVPRIVTTASFDLSSCASAGVNICFDMLMAAQGGSTPCEGPDEPQEGIYLQYSTNNGTTWTTLHYFDPNGGNDPQYVNWNNWCYAVPTAALTSNVRFRWFQDADSGAEYDHWGLDNIVIYCNDPSYNIVWQHDGYNAGPTGGIHPNLATPHSNTTYSVSMSNGTNTCTGSVSVVVQQPVLHVNAGNDTVVCTGTCVQLNATAKVVERPAAIRTYANNQPDTAELASFGGLLTQGATVGINVTTLNMTTVLPGSILSVCIDQAKLQTIPFFGPNASALRFVLQCPNGDTINLIPAGGITGNGGLGSYNTILNQTCFVPAGGSISSGAVPYSGNYAPAQSFDNLAGCTANGVWNLIVLPATTSVGGSVVITGWRINFDDPELAYTGNYVWSPTTNMTGANSLTPTVCPTGPATYTLTLTDTAGCATASDVFNIDTQTCCSFSLGVAVTQPSCGQNNGSITITPSVAGTYTYAWAGGANSATRSNLAAGGYAVTVTDVVNNCTQDTVIQLNSNSSMVANLSINNQPTCAGNDGSVSLTLSGGTAPYNIVIDTGGTPISLASPFPVPAPGQTLSNLAPMTVDVTVTDAQGCIATASAILLPPTNCCSFSAITATLVQPTCGQSNGGITVTGGNGSGTYTYAWSGGLGNNASINNVAAGTYTVTVTDGSPSCTVDSTFTLNSSSNLSVQLNNVSNPTCAGNDGAISVTLSGGTAPYSVLIDTGGTPFTVVSPIAGAQPLSGLGPMAITVTVTDAQSCTATDNVVLTAPTNCCTFTLSAAITQPTCAASDGAIVLTAANGSGNYTYNWAGGLGTGNSVTGLAANNYNVTVTDAGFANCTIDTLFSLSNLNAPVVSNIAVVDETCPGSGDGTIALTATGGTGSLSYNWGTNPVQTTSTAINLTAGVYNFTVSDANSCQTTGSALVGSGICCLLSTSASVVPPSCGQSVGSINVTVTTAGVTPYEYSLDGVSYSTSATFSNVSAGNYSVYTRDANGCGDTVVVNMPTGGANLQLAMGFVGTSCYGLNDGEANVTSINGIGPYAYIWSNALTTDTIRNLVPGNYSVTVTDNVGCTGTGAVLVSDALPLTTTLGNDIQVCDGTPVVLTAQAGFVSYAWSTGDNTATTTPTVSNTYTVTVTNANGCTASDDVLVTFIPTPLLDLGDDKLVYEGDHVAIFSGVPNAGQNAVYNWQPADYLSCATCANPVALAIDTITYTLVYNDGNGCTTTDNVTLNVIPVVELYWPNAFSPNGDGNNDFYMPYGSNVKLIEWKIFNRWGEKVFQSTSFFQGWDGTYKGEMQNPQLFVYEANVTMMNNSTKKFKGSFMLIR